MTLYPENKMDITSLKAPKKPPEGKTNQKWLLKWEKNPTFNWLTSNQRCNLTCSKLPRQSTYLFPYFISKHKLVGLFSSDDSKNDEIKTSLAYCNKNGYTSNRDINWIKIWDCVGSNHGGKRLCLCNDIPK